MPTVLGTYSVSNKAARIYRLTKEKYSLSIMLIAKDVVEEKRAAGTLPEFIKSKADLVHYLCGVAKHIRLGANEVTECSIKSVLEMQVGHSASPPQWLTDAIDKADDFVKLIEAGKIEEAINGT